MDASDFFPEGSDSSQHLRDRHHLVSVMTWLEREGYLVFKGVTLNEEYQLVQLTSLGIAAIESKKFAPNGETVRETVEKGELSSAVLGR